MCKFAVLQAYSRQLYYQMNSLAGIFWQHFKSPPCSPMYWLKPLHQILKSLPPSNGGGRGGGTGPLMFSTPVGNPEWWWCWQSTVKTRKWLGKFIMRNIQIWSLQGIGIICLRHMQLADMVTLTFTDDVRDSISTTKNGKVTGKSGLV